MFFHNVQPIVILKEKKHYHRVHVESLVVRTVREAGLGDATI
ncbi:MAG: hypothetical protein ACOVKP_01485 [Flavobacterium sp.]